MRKYVPWRLLSLAKTLITALRSYLGLREAICWQYAGYKSRHAFLKFSLIINERLYFAEQTVFKCLTTSNEVHWHFTWYFIFSGNKKVDDFASYFWYSCIYVISYICIFHYYFIYVLVSTESRPFPFNSFQCTFSNMAVANFQTTVLWIYVWV